MTHHDFTIAPSLLSANFAHLGEEAKSVLKAGANALHFDVMDNHYVPNLTMGPMFCDALRKDGIDAFMDVHLMIDPVESMIPRFIEAGASRITVHPSACQDVKKTLAYIRETAEAGLALNPDEPLEILTPYLKDLDFILIMTVNPGFGGQAFIASAFQKIPLLYALLKRQGLSHVKIGIDGGVNLDNLPLIKDSGADTLIAGSAIFGTSDYSRTLDRMWDILR